MSTNVASVTSHFPDVENGFTTTLASTISAGAATVPLNSVGGYTNGQPAVFIVDPSDATKKQTFTGIVDTSGVQVTNVVWTAGTNQTHVGGATIVDYATATHIAMISKGILVHADQDGTLKAGAVDNAAVLASDVVTTAKMLDSAVTPAKLQSGTGSGWAWSSWTPTLTNLSGGTLNYAKYIQVGKTVHWRLKYTLAGAGVTGLPRITLPVTAHSDYVSFDHFDMTGQFQDATGFIWQAFGYLASTSAFDVGYLNTSLNFAVTSSTAPFTWAVSDSIKLSGTYEAA